MRRALLILLALGSLSGCGGGRELQAEFASARGLVVGNDVRVGGAVAGSVEAISLSARGTAIVTLSLADDEPAPRADAVAAIRPADLLGDTYVAYGPGTDEAALDGRVPLAQTTTVARLDDLLATFDPGVRAALRALLVEGGIALDRRGADLARLTVALRPALREADAALRALDAERADLAALVADAERAAAPLAARAEDAGAAVERFAEVLDATAARPVALGAGLDGLPATLRALRSTSVRLAGAAGDARALAERLGAVAPLLAEVTAGAPALLEDARSATRAASPALGDLTALLRDARPTLEDADRGLGSLAEVGPETAELAAIVADTAPGISKGFFDNFADQAAEPGDQPFDPFADPLRAYWRGAAVFTCESFGVPVAPGCLRRFLGVQRSERERRRPRVPVPAPVATQGPAPTVTPRPSPPGVPAVPDVPKLPRVPVPEPVAPVVDGAQDTADGLLDFLLGP